MSSQKLRKAAKTAIAAIDDLEGEQILLSKALALNLAADSLRSAIAQPDDREPPHCPTCHCGSPDPLVERIERLKMALRAWERTDVPDSDPDMPGLMRNARRLTAEALGEK